MGAASIIHPFEIVRKAFAVPDRSILPSEWAEEHRVLRDKDTSEPGPWKNSRAPYLAGIMDAGANPDIQEVIIIKAPQVGMSEALRNLMGWWIDEDPGPILYVMPIETGSKEVLQDRIRPMIEETPRLQKYGTGKARDINKSRIVLRNCFIHLGWAGSPASLATRPCRYVILDESAKFPAFSGNEADPVALARKRTSTYRDRAKLFRLTTPNHRNEATWRDFDSCPVKFFFYVPCPHCGEYQVLDFQQMRWEKRENLTPDEQATAILHEELAWMECLHCQGKMEEKQKPAMLIKGVWATLDQTVSKDGVVSGEIPYSRRVAFHISALYSNWVSWHSCAADFILAGKDVALLMDFRNNVVAMPFEIQHAKVVSDDFKPKIEAGHEPFKLPDWASLVIATADTQKDHFWYALRCWGHGFRSRLVYYGRVGTFEELKKICLDTLIPYADAALGMIYPSILLIDAGGTIDEGDKSRTDEVYQFARKDPTRIMALRGHGGKRDLDVPYQVRQIKYQPPNTDAAQAYPVTYLRVNVSHYKDVLTARIKSSNQEIWELHKDVQLDYRQQMSAEHKIMEKVGTNLVPKWVKRTASAANHLWDAEVYQGAGADLMNVGTIPPPEQLKRMREAEKKWREQAGQGLRTPDGRPFDITER